MHGKIVMSLVQTVNNNLFKVLLSYSYYQSEMVHFSGYKIVVILLQSVKQ